MKNDLFLRTLAGQTTERPPVWMMRQAGRYLPDFRALRDQYSFFDRVQTPELAAEITIMPVNQIGVDAAILFSDILVIPQAMGMQVDMVESRGPVLPSPIRSHADIEKLQVTGAEENLHYVYDAIRLTLSELDGRVPLIGFAGAPWTIFCYMVEGGGSKDYSRAKRFCVEQPAAAEELLWKITQVTIQYLLKKVEAGVHTVQLFDSWGGVLSPEMYRRFSLPFLDAITKALSPQVPVILFAKGCPFALEELSRTGASALGIDWTVTPQEARRLAGNDIVLQGNFDPSCLYASPAEIRVQTQKMVHEFGTQRYIANLGHGILPDIPVDHARTFVETVTGWNHGALDLA